MTGERIVLAALSESLVALDEVAIGKPYRLTKADYRCIQIDRKLRTGSRENGTAAGLAPQGSGIALIEMKTPNPTPLALTQDDAGFLEAVAVAVLGGANVAGTNAEGLARRGLDPDRVARLIPGFGAAVATGGFVFKKVEPEPETPTNFGLFVREREAAANNGSGVP
jgi:hypothetical protein